MDEDLKQYLDTKFAQSEAGLDTKFAQSEAGLDTKFAQSEVRLDTKFAQFEVRLDTKFAQSEVRLIARLDRAAEAFASEMGSLHTEIQAIDARQRRDAGLTTTLMDLVMKQSRWHQDSDNKVADILSRQTEFARKLEDLRRE